MGQENSNPRRRRLVAAVAVAAALAAVPAGAALAESGGGGTGGGGTEGQATARGVQQSQPRDGDRDRRDCPEDRQRAQPEAEQL
jgi:hypothetical protein